MGAGGSVPKEDDGQFVYHRRKHHPFGVSDGIEQQIPVEFKPRKRLGAPRGSNQQSNVLSFRSLSNSFTQNQGNGFKSKGPGASLRSVLSNDTAVIDSESNIQLEKLNREFENFKLSKQNEIADMQKREQKLESENKRLRGEIQALQKTCTRLRNERDSAVENENQALERAHVFEEDRNNILQRLRLLEEDLGSQQGHMSMAGGHLSANNGRYNQSHESEHGGTSDTSSCSPQHNPVSLLPPNNTSSPTNEIAIDITQSAINSRQTMPTAPPQPCVDSFRFEASVKPSVVVPSAFIHWPGDKETVYSELEFVIGYFERQLGDDVDQFTDAWYPNYETNLIENHGLSMRCTSKQLNGESTQALSSTTNIFIIFLEKKLSESECKSLQSLLNVVKNCSTLKLLFCFKKVEQSSLNNNMHRLKKRLSKINANESYNCLSIENYQQMEPLVTLVNESVDQFVSKHFSEGSLGECTCNRDMHGLLYQKDAFSSYLGPAATSAASANIDQYVFCINRHIVKEGPVPPLIIKSDPGCGKSTVLAHFLKKHKQSHASTKVLYHFTETSECSRDGVTMMKRFAFALNSLKNPIATNVTHSSSNYSNFSHLLEMFPRNSAKFPRMGATSTDGAPSNNNDNNDESSSSASLLIIAIDSADKLHNAVDILDWIQDPLPVDVRLVLSVDTETCPSTWMSMTSIYLKPPIQSFLPSLTVIQRETFQRLKLNSPYFAQVLTGIETSITGPSSENETEETRGAAETKELVLGTLIKTVATNSNIPLETVHAIIYLLSVSYNGLKVSWIYKMLQKLECQLPENCQKSVHDLCQKLIKFRILSERRGTFIAGSFLVSKFIETIVSAPQEDLATKYQKSFLEFLMTRISPEHGALDVTLEIVHILNSNESYLSKLREYINQISVFIHLYKFDFTHLLVEIFAKLGIDKESISDQYLDELRSIEREGKRYEYMIDSMEALAAFNCDYGLFSKASHLYQRCLEVREININPDDPAIAKTLYLNALLHFKWEKIDVAETLLKEAIQIQEYSMRSPEGENSVDYMQLVQNLQLLSAIYQRLGKVRQLEMNAKKLTYLRSMVFIKDYLGTASSAPVQSFSTEVLLESTPDSVQKANYLNEHAVLMFYQGNLDEAETSFTASLVIREKLLGKDHWDCSQSLFNLGGLYFEKKEFRKSLECFQDAVNIRRQIIGQINLGGIAGGSNTRLLLSTYQWLVIALRKCGHTADAVTALKDLTKLNIAVFGENHHYVATNYANTASIYCEMKQFSEAEPLFEKALMIYSSTLGAYDDKVCDTLTNMALLKYEMNDTEAAVNYFKQAQDRQTYRGNLTSARPSNMGNTLSLTPTAGRHRANGSMDFQSLQSLNGSVIENSVS